MNGWVPAALLRHRGHGPLHWDLVLGGAARCPTLQVTRRRARWIAPHRSRYLAFAGPIPGKGAVDRVWHGLARVHRCGRWLRIERRGCEPWSVLPCGVVRIGRDRTLRQ